MAVDWEFFDIMKALRKGLFSKWVLLTCGLFFMGMGISLITRAELGTSPISSVPLVLSYLYPLTFGQLTFLLRLAFLLLECLVLAKRFRVSILLQVVIGPIFGFFTDFGMYATAFLKPRSYLAQLAMLFAGCFVLSFGIVLQIRANFIMNPGEGLVRAIAERLRKHFGSIKICFDSTLVAIALVISAACLHAVRGVREGTLVSAIVVGYTTKLWYRVFDGVEAKFAHRSSPQSPPA